MKSKPMNSENFILFVFVDQRQQNQLVLLNFCILVLSTKAIITVCGGLAHQAFSFGDNSMMPYIPARSRP